MPDAAIVIDNLVQFYSIKRGIDDLISQNVHIDIYIPDDSKAVDLAEYTYDKVYELGYKPLKKATKRHYKVLLEPYPKLEQIESLHGITYDYRLKYKYSLISAKPNPVYSPAWNMPYDAILVHSAYEYDLLQVYTKTHCIKPMKYSDKKVVPLKNTQKKILLYLPTFNDVNPESFLEVECALADMKKDYTIVIKTHHAIQFREKEKSHDEFLHRVADVTYDQSTPLEQIINSADAVLTGNSGSVFEALYTNTPVSVFTDDANKHKFGVNTFHYQLIVNGVIPYTHEPKSIHSIIEESLEKISKQRQIAHEQFQSKYIQYRSFCDVILEYVNCDKDMDVRRQLRGQLNDYIQGIKQERDRKDEALAQMTSMYQKESARNVQNRRKIHNYDSSLSWALTRPLRASNQALKRFIKHEK